MAILKHDSSLRKRLKQSQSLGVLKLLPSFLRGSIRGETWKDTILEEHQTANLNQLSCNSHNPLRTYFDSITEGRGIWKWLHYFDIYHRHFQKFVGKEVRVVEVGIYSGGSLDMWKAYFGPRCLVYGVDIKEACKVYEDERTRVFIGDQSDRDFWKKFREQVPKIDVLIDDGGHMAEQQIVTLEETLPYMRPGGVYLCEDIVGTQNRFAAYMNGLGAALNAFEQKGVSEARVIPEPFQRAIYSVHLYPFVAVIEKACHPVQEFCGPKHGSKWQPFL